VTIQLIVNTVSTIFQRLGIQLVVYPFSPTNHIEDTSCDTLYTIYINCSSSDCSLYN